MLKSLTIYSKFALNFFRCLSDEAFADVQVSEHVKILSKQHLQIKLVQLKFNRIFERKRQNFITCRDDLATTTNNNNNSNNNNR